MISETTLAEPFGSSRPVAQVGDDPALAAFSQEVQGHAFMPSWGFFGEVEPSMQINFGGISDREAFRTLELFASGGMPRYQ